MSRRARVVTVSLVIVSVLAGAWFATSWLQRRQVDVDWAGQPRCTGSEVSSVRVDGGVRVPAFAMRRSMDCRRTVRVTNHGWFGVTVDKVTLPLMGPGGGAAVQVSAFEGRSVKTAGDAVDAIFDVRRTVAAGGSQEFEVEFSFRPGGCMGDGGSMWLDGLPRMRVKALGLPGNRENAEYTAFTGTADSSCDS